MTIEFIKSRAYLADAQLFAEKQPSITGYTRLETQPATVSLKTGLQAPLADPLWMLARQWQVGEFRAEDAGSPVLATWRAESAPLTRLHAGAIAPNTNRMGTPYDVAALPLEAVVERQRTRPVDPQAATSSLQPQKSRDETRRSRRLTQRGAGSPAWDFSVPCGPAAQPAAEDRRGRPQIR